MYTPTRSAITATAALAALALLPAPAAHADTLAASSRGNGPLLADAATSASSFASAQAGDPDAALMANDSSREWRFQFNTWIWLMGMDGDVSARGRDVEVNADFGDILDASDSLVAFSGRLEIGYGRLAAFVDGFYADLGADDQSGPLGLADVDVTLEQTIVDFGLMYRLGDWEPEGAAAANHLNTTLDLYAGARYSKIKLKLDPAMLASVSHDVDWLDPIVGAKLVLPLSRDWHFQVNGDVGGFGVESDFTWSTTAVFGYSFELFGHPATVLAGYRAIGWDYSEGSGDDEFEFDMTQHGPIIGFSLLF